MATTLFLKAGAMALGMTYVEKKYLPSSLSVLTEPSITNSSVAALNFLPRAYGLVLLILTISTLWVTMYGMVVGDKRKVYMERAKKDGEKDAETRYKLPNLYVDGQSVHARAFNCVQRSHQQILETLPQYLFTSVVSGLCFPISTFAICTLWLVGRIVWAKGYASSEGDPSKRYSHPLSMHIWTSYLALFIMSLMTAVNILAGDLFSFW